MTVCRKRFINHIRYLFLSFKVTPFKKNILERCLLFPGVRKRLLRKIAVEIKNYFKREVNFDKILQFQIIYQDRKRFLTIFFNKIISLNTCKT